MATPFKVCIDCADPHGLAPFWAEALGYVVEDHSAMIKQLLDAGVVGATDVVEVDGRQAWRTAAAIRDPDGPVDERGVGRGGRGLFPVVAGPEVGKKRGHLDLHVGPERQAGVGAPPDALCGP